MSGAVAAGASVDLEASAAGADGLGVLALGVVVAGVATSDGVCVAPASAGGSEICRFGAGAFGSLVVDSGTVAAGFFGGFNADRP